MRGEFVDVAGTRLYYFAAGTRGAGPPILFLHGFPGSSHSWRFLTPLMPAGHRLVVLDLMACGRSDGAGADCGTIAAQAARVRGLLDELRIDRAVVVGHGVGGAVAQCVAVENASRIAALALVSSIGFGVWPRGLGRLARAVRPAARLLGASVMAGFVHGSALRGFVDREEGRRSLDHSLRAYPGRLGVASLLAMFDAMRDPAAASLGDRVAATGIPVAVIWGADDPFLAPAVGERFRAAIPDATLDVIPGARHFVAEDAPERCARAIGGLLDRAR